MLEYVAISFLFIMVWLMMWNIWNKNLDDDFRWDKW